MLVIAESAYPTIAPGPRVRIEGFIPHLRREGVELDFQPTVTSSEYETVLAGGGSLAKAGIVARSALRASRRSPRQGPLLVYRLRSLAPVPGFDPPRQVDFYDFDDALYLGSISAANRRFAWLKREGERWRAYVRRAGVVIAGNEHLAGEARKHSDRVVVIPSCVEPQGQPLREHGERDPVTVGWIGSASTAAYLEPILPALERLNRSRLRAKLVMVGAQAALREPWIEARPWALDRQAADLASFDIGVAPLPDTAWARGKCGYKLLQYFAAGVPAIASPVGVNRELAGGDQGLLAASEEEWHGALLELVGDAQRRAEMGRAARSFAEEHYSYRRWAPELARVLREGG